MLRHKINAAILITFAAIALVFTVIQRPLHQQRLQAVMERITDVLHIVVDRDRDPLANALVDNRIREIEMRLGHMLELEGITAISVFDKGGKLLCSVGESPNKDDLPAGDLRNLSQDAPIRRERIRGKERLEYVQELRVIGERYGFIHIFYSLADIEAEQRKAFGTFGILLLSVLVVMLVLLNLLLSNMIIQPIASLQSAMQRIHSGELGSQVQTTAQDELGELARTFNVMSLELHQKQHEYEELNRLVKEQAESRRRHEIAEAANHAKSEFLRTISHEIRTPLNAILGFSELARQTPYTETLKLYIERIAASGKILNALVNGVLDLAGIEAGKFTLHPDNFQLHTVLHTAVKPFQFNTTDETVSWKIAIDPTIPSQLYGDSTRLTQVLVNLISNAVKFTQRGTIAVSVTLEKRIPDFARSFERAEESLWLHFSVEDTGIGIPEDEQASIFQQFFQGQEARRHFYGGTGGIGMTIVSKIVDTMRGKIWFESTPDIGTHVHVILPFKQKTKEKTERTMAVSLGALRILIAEDNSSNRMMLQEWLTLLGLRVETAENGMAALERWNTANFDVILMDKQMPGMDGLEATREIRRAEKHQGGYTHIIALTAAATTEDQAQCLAAGMDAYLTKPIDIAALLQKLNTLFPEGGIMPEEDVERAVSPKAADEDNDELFSFDNMPKSWKSDPAKKEQYIALMKGDIQESLQRLEQAIQHEDPAALSKAAHKLKGAIGKIRAEVIQDLVEQLETMRRQGDLEAASLKITMLKDELARVLGGNDR